MLYPVHNSSEYSSPIQNGQQDCQSLELTLKYHGKNALMAALNSGSYSQETLYLLLCSMCFKGKSDVVTMMFETKSYTAKMVAHIVLDAFENSSTEFAVELLTELKDASFKATVLDTTLELVAERGADLQGASYLIRELVHLGANSTKTALELANACDHPDASVIDYLNTTCTDWKVNLSMQEHVNVPLKNSQNRLINSTQISAKKNSIVRSASLNSANTVPADVWLSILSFLSTQQELAPLRLVSRTFKTYADHPVLAATPYAELDYSSPLFQKIKIYGVGVGMWDAAPQCFIILSGCIAITARDDNLYHYDLNNGGHHLFAWEYNWFPVRKTLTGHAGYITAICDFKKDVIVSSSEDMTIRVWNLEKSECIKVLKGHQAKVISLTALNDSLIASTSTDKTIRIWDIQKGECIKILDAHANPAKLIIKLPQKNLILSLGRYGISRWDIETGESQYCALPNKQHCWSIDLLSDDQIILNNKKFLTITTISSLFEENSPNLGERIACVKNRYFSRICILPNGYIACLTAQRVTPDVKNVAILLIYDTSEKKFISGYQLDGIDASLSPHLRLLADHRIAVCDKTLQIIPFRMKNNKNVVVQKNPVTEGDLMNQNCVIS